MGNMCDCGRDLEGTELAEYCDSRCLEACDMGRGRVLRREGVDVVNGGKAGWFAIDEGEAASGAGEEAGDDDVSTMAAIAMIRRGDATRDASPRDWPGRYLMTVMAQVAQQRRRARRCASSRALDGCSLGQKAGCDPQAGWLSLCLVGWFRGAGGRELPGGSQTWRGAGRDDRQWHGAVLTELERGGAAGAVRCPEP